MVADIEGLEASRIKFEHGDNSEVRIRRARGGYIVDVSVSFCGVTGLITDEEAQTFDIHTEIHTTLDAAMNAAHKALTAPPEIISRFPRHD